MVHLIRLLLDSGVQPARIGVIALYRAQVVKVSELLARAFPSTKATNTSTRARKKRNPPLHAVAEEVCFHIIFDHTTTHTRHTHESPLACRHAREWRTDPPRHAVARGGSFHYAYNIKLCATLMCMHTNIAPQHFSQRSFYALQDKPEIVTRAASDEEEEVAGEEGTAAAAASAAVEEECEEDEEGEEGEEGEGEGDVSSKALGIIFAYAHLRARTYAPTQIRTQM